MSDRGIELASESTGEQKEIKGERLEAFTKAVEENSDKTETVKAESKPETQTKTVDQKQKPESNTTKAHPETMFAGNDWHAPSAQAPDRARGNLGESATPQSGPAYVADRDPNVVVQTGENIEDIEKLKK